MVWVYTHGKLLTLRTFCFFFCLIFHFVQFRWLIYHQFCFLFNLLFFLHPSLQYTTLSQFFSHFFLQVKGLLHDLQILLGKYDLFPFMSSIDVSKHFTFIDSNSGYSSSNWVMLSLINGWTNKWVTLFQDKQGALQNVVFSAILHQRCGAGHER